MLKPGSGASGFNYDNRFADNAPSHSGDTSKRAPIKEYFQLCDTDSLSLRRNDVCPKAMRSHIANRSSRLLLSYRGRAPSNNAAQQQQ